MEPVWTTPVNWAAAQLVDDTDLDEQISQNLVYLHGPRGYYPTTVDVTGTTEPNILSHTVNASDLGTTRMLRATILGDLYHTGTANTLTVRVKLGGTTLYSDSMTYNGHANTNRAQYVMECLMGMANSATAEFLVCTLDCSWLEVPASGNGRIGTQGMEGTFGSIGTSAVDTGSNQAFVVSVQWSAVHADTRWRKYYACVELI